ncbi:MAG: hypothetical protein KY428_10735, partial [Bacteroidetes bacterium]|nr:hypothetical protein [Bacteroidota bacterium]
EETMEMFGLLLFIYALLHYMDVMLGRLSLVISAVQAESPSADNLASRNPSAAKTVSGTHLVK